MAWNTIDFGRLLFNTVAIASIGTFGTLISSICVAYGFSRFRIPGKNGLFLLLLSTIILPFQVTLIPTFALFSSLGWTGTWLPLLVPHFFANAYNVFLLRQFFGTIPRDLDEAAMIDGASPFRILVSVILPQSIPAVVAVGLFHFFWAWNDYFLPLIYLQGNTAIQPISVGIAELQRALLPEADPDRSLGHHGPRSAGRDLLPGSAGVHAWRGHHRRREIAVRYGHFDDDHREYVITRPDTPLPWINYLGSEDVLRADLEHRGRVLVLPGRAPATAHALPLQQRAARLSADATSTSATTTTGRVLVARPGSRRATSSTTTRAATGWATRSSRRGEPGSRRETRYFVPLGETWRSGRRR